MKRLWADLALIAAVVVSVIPLTTTDSYALRCGDPDFFSENDKAFSVRKKLAQTEAIQEVQKYDLILWGRLRQWQCLGWARFIKAGTWEMQPYYHQRRIYVAQYGITVP